jgi:glycerol-3-phosphate dehydrogenase
MAQRRIWPADRGAADYLQVEPVYAATHEGALHLDDVLTGAHMPSRPRTRGLAAAEVAS